MKKRITIELEETELYAIAELCKRIRWDQMRELSVDEAEAEAMRDATDRLRSELAYAGISVR